MSDLGSTRVDADDLEGLIPTYVATRGELNELEQRSIALARAWAASRRWTPAQLLDEAALRALHRRMFGDVWRWAGELRRSDKNIGVPWFEVPQQLRALLIDARAWVDEGSGWWSADETAVRLHHRLVAIHVFANGNGRHARLVADLMSGALGGSPFSWGRFRSQSGESLEDVRSAYISSLREADNGDVTALLDFARS